MVGKHQDGTSRQPHVVKHAAEPIQLASPEPPNT